MKVRLSNIQITCDVELLDGPLVPTTPVPVVIVPPVVVVPDPPEPVTRWELPNGYSTDTAVGYYVLVDAMTRAGLTPIGVQRHGDQIIAALKASYPDLDVYLSPSDAPVWPGFGSLDVTIDSGKGGWSFQVDAPNKPGRVPWKPRDQR
jgi:hypothetical protein